MILCYLGCGQEAHHQLKNGKWCCSKHVAQCPIMRKKNGKGNKNKFLKGQHPNCGKIAWNKGLSRTKEEKEKIKQRTIEEMSKPEIREKIKKGLENYNFKKENHPLWNGGYYARNIARYDTYAHKINFCEEVTALDS